MSVDYRVRLTTSEVQVLDFMMQTLLRGGTADMAVRHKSFASLCRKVGEIKGKVKERELQDRYEATLCKHCGGDKEGGHELEQGNWRLDPTNGIAYRCPKGNTHYEKRGDEAK